MLQLWPQFVSYWGHTRSAPFDKIYLSSISSLLKLLNMSPPWKSGIFIYMHFGALRRRKDIKTRLVYKISENFLSNEHENWFLLFWYVWEMNVNNAYPPQNDQQLRKYVPLHMNTSLAPRSFMTLISQSESWGMYFIKWSTSGEAPSRL